MGVTCPETDTAVTTKGLFIFKLTFQTCHNLLSAISFLNHIWITPYFRKTHTGSTLLVKYNEVSPIHKKIFSDWLHLSNSTANTGLQADLMPLPLTGYTNSTSLTTIKNTLLPISSVLILVAKPMKTNCFYSMPGKKNPNCKDVRKPSAS